MGLLGQSYDPYGGMTSLLGVDQKAMRNQALWNGLAAAGFTLMGDKNLGNAGGAFLTGTNQARDDYMRNAMDAYRMKTADEELKYRRGRDTKDDERQARLDQQNAWRFAQEQDAAELAESQRLGQQSAVGKWTQDFQSQGGDLFDPGMQSWLRGQGVQGVNPQDTQRYDRMQPYMAAQDYGGAFQQMTAEQGKSDLVNVGKGSRLYDPSTRQWIEPPAGPGGASTDNFDDEAKLRGSYEKETQPFAKVRESYQRVLASSQDQTGASDIGLVFSFMKMLDPDSAVREGEYATAESAGGVPAKLVSLYNQALNGQRLSPQVRAEFQQQAGQQFRQQQETYVQIKKKYENLSKAYGFDPARIATDMQYGVDVVPTETAPANIPQEAISELMADPSPEAIREFDEAFGQGAAAAILGGR